MAFSNVIAPGLSAKKARDSARGTSPNKFLYTDQTIGDATAPDVADTVQVDYGDDAFNGYVGRQPMRISPDGEVDVLPAGRGPFSDPEVAGRIAMLEKATIKGVAVPGDLGPTEAQWKADGWDMSGRARKNDAGEIPEWDHVMLFSLSRDEAARLSADDLNTLIRLAVDEARKPILTEGLAGRNPDGSANGFKDMVLMPLHQDKDNNVHIQAYVNRVAWNFEAKATGNSEKDTGSIWGAYMANLNSRLKEAGIDIVLGDATALKTRTGTTPEAVGLATAAMEAAGAETPPMLTVGPARAQGRQLPEATTDDDATLAREEEDISRRMSEDGARLILIQKAREAVARRQTLESSLAAAEEATKNVEAARKAAQAALEASQAEIATVQADAVQAAHKAAQEAAAAAEVLLQEQTRADLAESLAVQRFAEIETLHETIKGEPERQDIASASAVLPIQEQVDKLRVDLAAETKARQEAVAELAEERRTFPDRLSEGIKKAVDDAKANWEAEIAGPIRKQIDDAKAELQKAQDFIEEQAAIIKGIPKQIADAEARMTATIKATVEASLAATRNVVAAPLLAVGEAIRSKREDVTPASNPVALPSPEKVEEAPALEPMRSRAGPAQEEPAMAKDEVQADAPAQEVVMPPKGQEFYRVTPDQWTPEQKNQAQVRFEKDKATAKTPARQQELAGRTLEQHGEAAHAAWQLRQIPKP